MKARYFVVLMIVLVVVGLFGMRQNNITAYEKLDEVMALDADEIEVDEELEELEEYVFSHMNASMQFTLHGSFRRAQEEAVIEADESVGSGLSQAAQDECEVEGSDPQVVAECYRDYVTSRLDDNDDSIDEPEREDFTYTLHSPPWTTDLPGFAFFGAVLSGLVAVVLYIRYWLRQVESTGR